MSPGTDPLALFDELLSQAWRAGVKHAHAMTLSTVSADGQPSSRQVLLQSFDERGFVFYTNLESRKGTELAGNARCSLNLYWRELDRQVTILGRVERVSDAEADAYFASRPRGSRWGAWASHQSRVLSSKTRLLTRALMFAVRHPISIPRPPHWSGYRVVPHYFEFWREGRFRLHERFRYVRQGDSWVVERLYP